MIKKTVIISAIVISIAFAVTTDSRFWGNTGSNPGFNYPGCNQPSFGNPSCYNPPTFPPYNAPSFPNYPNYPPSQNPPTYPGNNLGTVNSGKCTLADRNRTCTTPKLVFSCVCRNISNTTNCTTELVDRCTTCKNLQVISVTKGCCAKDNVSPPTLRGACAPDERNRSCFAYNPVPSCVCFFNQTCVNLKADRCTDCGDDDIFSINKGYCKSCSLFRGDDICQPEERDDICPTAVPVTNCVCTFNGTCTTQQGNRCNFCTNPNVTSVSRGCCKNSCY